MATLASMRIRVASLPPPIAENPYQRLLYEALQEHGVELVQTRRLTARWLLRSRALVDVLHFHWLTPYYRHEGGGPVLRRMLSWVRLYLFAVRLALARVVGYRVVWTVHEVDPHEAASRRLDRAAARLVAAASRRLIAHDAPTVAKIEETLPSARGKVMLIPHATFTGVYPSGRDRAEVLEELAVPSDAFVFLCFGHLRGYKDIDVLMDALGSVADDRIALIVAGLPLSEAAAEALRKAAANDSRIRLMLGYVPDERVAELFGACDAAVVSRGDGGTSGVVVLALSLGVPVVAAARPAYEELTGHGEAGWHFRPGDVGSLAETLARVAADRIAVRTKADAAAACRDARRWEEAAALTASALRGF